MSGQDGIADRLRSENERLKKDIRSLAIKPTVDWPVNETGGARMRPDGRLGCVDCGELYGGPRFPDLVIDDESFAKVAPNPPDGGLICPNCLNARLEVAGMFGVRAVFMSGAMVNDEGLAAQDLQWVRESFGKIKTENDTLRNRLQVAVDALEEGHHVLTSVSRQFRDTTREEMDPLRKCFAEALARIREMGGE